MIRATIRILFIFGFIVFCVGGYTWLCIKDMGVLWGLVFSIISIPVMAVLTCFAFTCEPYKNNNERSDVMGINDLPNYSYFIIEENGGGRVLYKDPEGFVRDRNGKHYFGEDLYSNARVRRIYK
jgi:hypothetical protein